MGPLPSFEPGARALVTGAAGFIGSALLQRLLQANVEVHALYRRTPPPRESNAVWRQCDVEDEIAVQRVFAEVRPHYVFHLASYVSGTRERSAVMPMLRSNLLSAINLLSAATEFGCRRIILSGSMEEPSPSGEWPIPSSPYAAAKFGASAYGRMFHRLYQTPVVVLRLFMVYGPGQMDFKKLVPYTIRSLLQGVAPQLSSGRRNVDWVFVEDVVDSYVRSALVGGIEGATFDVASGRPVTVRALVERLADLVGSGVRPQFGAIAERLSEQEPTADLSVSERRLGWRPATSLDDGLQTTVAWYRRHLASLQSATVSKSTTTTA